MTTRAIDRPAAIRAALCDLVAERGFHGASMSAIAERAGVAVGTAYVHYTSKDDLVFATYLEIKRDLAEAVLDGLDPDAPPADRYARIAHGTYRHMVGERGRAGFLIQLEASPYYERAKELLAEEGDRLSEAAAQPDLVAALVPLPPTVVWTLSLGAMVRLAAAGIELSNDELALVVEATWRAITAP